MYFEPFLGMLIECCCEISVYFCATFERRISPLLHRMPQVLLGKWHRFWASISLVQISLFDITIQHQCQRDLPISNYVWCSSDAISSVIAWIRCCPSVMYFVKLGNGNNVQLRANLLPSNVSAIDIDSQLPKIHAFPALVRDKMYTFNFFFAWSASGRSISGIKNRIQRHTLQSGELGAHPGNSNFPNKWRFCRIKPALGSIISPIQSLAYNSRVSISASAWYISCVPLIN